MKKNKFTNTNYFKNSIIILMLLICIFITYYFHFILKTEFIFIQLFYFPIIIAVLWGRGAIGIWFSAILGTQLIIIHLLSPLETSPWEHIYESVMFLFVGSVMAIIYRKRQILIDEISRYSKNLKLEVEKKTEEIRESLEKEKAILEGIEDSIVVLDKDLSITWANKITFEKYGDSLVGKKCYTTIKKQTQPCDECGVRETFKDGKNRILEDHCIQASSLIKIKKFCSPSRNINGEVTSVVCILHKVTDIEQTQESLEESEERLKSVVRYISDAIIYINGDGKIIFLNEGAEKIFRYKSEEIVGKPLTLIIPEKFKQAHLKGIKGANIESSLKYSGRVRELIGLRKNGIEFPAELSISRWKVKNNLFYTAIVRDITERKKAEETIKQNYQKLQKTMEGTINTIAKIVETRDPYTAGHQLKVSKLATAIAREMKLPQDKIEGARIASLIHDIGKISIPSEILSKPTKLSKIEYSLIKDHSQIGYDILKSIEFPWPLAMVVLQHHERVDGSGYPQGLKDEDILMEAKIIGVADVVEAMSSHRPYRPALGIDKALEEISQNRGILYDSEIVDICIKLFKEKSFKF